MQKPTFDYPSGFYFLIGNYGGYVNPLIDVYKIDEEQKFGIEPYVISSTNNYACLVNDTPSELPRIPGVNYESAVFDGIKSTFLTPEGWRFEDYGESETEYPLSNYGVIQP